MNWELSLSLKWYVGVVSARRFLTQPKWHWQVQFSPSLYWWANRDSQMLNHITTFTIPGKCWSWDSNTSLPNPQIYTFQLYPLLLVPGQIGKDSGEEVILKLTLKRKTGAWFSGSLSAQSKQRGTSSSLEIIVSEGEVPAPVWIWKWLKERCPWYI